MLVRLDHVARIIRKRESQRGVTSRTARIFSFSLTFTQMEIQKRSADSSPHSIDNVVMPAARRRKDSRRFSLSIPLAAIRLAKLARGSAR